MRSIVINHVGGVMLLAVVKRILFGLAEFIEIIFDKEIFHEVNIFIACILYMYLFIHRDGLYISVYTI